MKDCTISESDDWARCHLDMNSDYLDGGIALKGNIDHQRVAGQVEPGGRRAALVSSLLAPPSSLILRSTLSPYRTPSCLFALKQLLF